MSGPELAQILVTSAMNFMSATGAKAITSGGRPAVTASPENTEHAPLLGQPGELRARAADERSNQMVVCRPLIDLIPSSVRSDVDDISRQSPGVPGHQSEFTDHPFGYLLDGIPPLKPTPPPNHNQPNPLRVARGQLTFDAEGTEGGPGHSRRIQWPGGYSGVTIGRGYDLGQHSAAEIRNDLTRAGISAEMAAMLLPAAKIHNTQADKSHTAFLNCHKMLAEYLPEISLEQQNKLFQNTYDEITEDAKRVSNAEGGSNWDQLDPAIRDIVVDLRYRGDYTRNSRKLIQTYIDHNDLAGLLGVMSDKTLTVVDDKGNTIKVWDSVPPDRFERRVEHLRAALQNKTVNQPTPAAPTLPNSTTVSHPPPRPLHEK